MSTPADTICLMVAGRRIDRFIGYRIEADLYCADNYFSLQLYDPGFDVPQGARCELRVNDQLCLTGIVDRIVDGVDKRGGVLTLEGRDLMGLLVDSYVESYPDVQNITLKALAEQLLANVPYINRKQVYYQVNLAGASVKLGEDAEQATQMGAALANMHIEPGQTIFEVLKRAAMIRGAMFYGLPDGSFVFGRPKVSGAPAFAVTHRRDGAGNNVFASQRVRDISRRYSKITLVGQQQGYDDFSASDVNVSATITDEQMPFYKPYVGTLNDDQQSPALFARMLLERQRADGFNLMYSLRGHSQGGKNFTVNELCRVRDEVRGIDGVYLVVSRAFTLSRADGCTTELRLSLPGVIR